MDYETGLFGTGRIVGRDETPISLAILHRLDPVSDFLGRQELDSSRVDPLELEQEDPVAVGVTAEFPIVPEQWNPSDALVREHRDCAHAWSGGDPLVQPVL